MLAFSASLDALGLTAGAQTPGPATDTSVTPREAARIFVWDEGWTERSAESLDTETQNTSFPSARRPACDVVASNAMVPTHGYAERFAAFDGKVVGWSDLALYEVIPRTDGELIVRAGPGFPHVIGVYSSSAPDTPLALLQDGRVYRCDFSSRTLLTATATIPNWPTLSARTDLPPTLIDAGTRGVFVGGGRLAYRIDPAGPITVVSTAAVGRSVRVEAGVSGPVILGLGTSLLRVERDGSLAPENMPWHDAGVVETITALRDGSEIAAGTAESASGKVVQVFRRAADGPWTSLLVTAIGADDVLARVFSLGDTAYLSFNESSAQPFRLQAIQLGPSSTLRNLGCARGTGPVVVRPLDPNTAVMIEAERFADGTAQTHTIHLLKTPR